MARRSATAWGDQAYLRQVQYRDGRKLSDRAQLHVKYSSARVAWFPWVSRQLTWPVEARVLEVGCGTGWFWVEAAPSLPDDLDLVLTDLSHGMVDTALGQLRGRGRHRRIAGYVADVQELPFTDREFDVVVANHMLYHVPEPPRAVGEMARVLDADGTVVVATNGRNHLAELWDIRDEVFGADSGRWFTEVFGIDNGGEMLRAAFDEVEWRPYEDRLLCRHADDVLTFLLSCPPGETAGPEELAHLTEVVQRCFDAGDGILEVTKETGVFVCRHPR
ncbi:MAG TPA: class I SAM-dependent methyltransferase [Acidimicrobiales bacterium]